MTVNSHLNLVIDAISTFSLAAQQNAYPLIKSLKLEYLKPDTQEPEVQAVPSKSLKVVLQAIPCWLEEETWLVDELAPGQILTLPKRDLRFTFDKLFGLTEEISLELSFRVLNEDEVILASATHTIAVLPANYWGGETRQPDLLAAFVKPNGVYVESLLRSTAELLERAGHGRVIDGYQSNTREKPYLMLAALWNVIFDQQLAYVSPPNGFARYGQRIRLASDISTSKIAACLDTSLLFASCIEAMGLNPVVALSKGHAFAGAWLIDERLPVLTNDDPMDVRKRLDNRDMVLFETTLVTNVTPVTFEQAKERARSLLAEECEDEFVYVIDIGQARARQIKPLSTVEERREEVLAKGPAVMDLPVVPPLPPVRADERVTVETPETRIDSWSRKLLDLSKRNSLLNLREQAVSIKLFCPDIASMEDELADGGRFRFISAEESPINDRERDPESFRMQSGSDLHKQYAQEQLGKQVLVANQSQKRLESCAVSLFRKAKNDLEEGGSNTLYLALGMLKWKENPEDDKSYRAPLILIPVSLSRKSARSPVTLQQLQDEDPIFNLTLIEFLQSEHDINLSEFKETLPTDDSGVDVPYIWHRVREAVSEHRGFEVVEELVLASFSFAKYLMWKDLRDRIDELKENPFVNHLVDHPKEPYRQETHFFERSEVDAKIDPAELYTPLNCDSSQLVAVAASAEPQDFVLEGPPGTGKSETIANIIAHNIGKGRKVLFVAEKMAALNVVYRRLQKVGLDHLCLELHSNKTNKRAVLDQLNRAWQKREGLSQQEWLQHVEQLKAHKDELNAYVHALHEKSPFGLTAREAIAKVSSKSKEPVISLGWPMNIEAGPVQSDHDLNQAREIVAALALAFVDVRELDGNCFAPITASTWSNVWQSKLTEKLKTFSDQLTPLETAITSLLHLLDIKPAATATGQPLLEGLSAITTLVDMAEKESIDFAMEKGAKERLAAIESLADNKRKFDVQLNAFKGKVTPQQLQTIPIDRWLQLKDEAASGWFKALVSIWKIKSEAKKLGFTALEGLQTIEQLRTIIPLQKSILTQVEQLQPYALWQGWETSPEFLQGKLQTGQTVLGAISRGLSLVDEPVELMIPLKKWLVEGRDYLEGSKLQKESASFAQLVSQYLSYVKELQELGFSLSEEFTLEQIRQSVEAILKAQPKLKSWCEWQGTKQKAMSLKLQAMVSGLEKGEFPPEQAAEQFDAAYSAWLAPLLIDANPVLREFKASTHEATIEKFRQLDQKLADITSDYIVALSASAVQSQDSRDNPPEFGVLAREIQRKTRHLPTRALIEQLGKSLLSLCPCLMMSPLSVAQFLPAGFRDFDLVVFDEASQMTTWDSVGAIARGRNVIVVGDPKQMPPTNFFSAASSSEDPEEEDLESILDQALAARLPLLRLMGHYRSRHETLIAFSNSKYYENALVTYPSSDTKESAVHLHRVDGAYAKGKGRNNVIEAKAVVDEIVRRLKSPAKSKLSMGVVTLNTDQQRTIEDLLDDARRRHPEIEAYFSSDQNYDGVFVKNLESVQGDERDVIILSLGFGPTEVGDKTMSMNFGPLNKSGGERRLNVAITRATTEVLIFSSFDSSMIDLNRTSAKAVEHLKHYLEFAERGPRALTEQTTAVYGTDQFDSDFEKAVAFDLREKGWKIQTQVGVSKFRVDLGIVHPDKPGVYLAGIECDGVSYHASPSARDRDRVRQAVLENLGWRILRLWSTDYFVDPETAVQKLDVQLRELVEKDKSELSEIEQMAEVVESVPDDAMTTILDVPLSETEIQQAQDTGPTGPEAKDYFADSNRQSMEQMARGILQEKPGITLQALALEVANLHDLARTSQKQIAHLRSIIEPWAGITEIDDQKPVVWPSADNIASEIPWRGVAAFGYPRLWSEIAYPEALGLARLALEKSPQDPVGYICDEFELKRRHDKTLSIFKSWVDEVKENSIVMPPAQQ
ncbi:DUF3320 domain-containing protein [Bowmanella denitrificans]|uniref:DUF3320 domain-containing protein n=1 Tax=Bowmanella denitrificans TaxID=366582 RepID=A0ABN0WW56_9ALTE